MELTRQKQTRNINGRKLNVNLHCHLQSLSEKWDFMNEWQLVESRPIQPGEDNTCPCGRSRLSLYFIIENKINGNRTFVGSSCIRNVIPQSDEMIDYFKYLMERGVYGLYRGQDNQGLQRFEFSPFTVITQRLPIVQHLNPPINQTGANTWEVKVKYLKPGTLEEGKIYWFKVKMKYHQGQLTFSTM